MYVKDGVVLSDAGFSIGEGVDKITFPPRWLAYATPADLARYGIEVVPEPEVTEAPDALEARFDALIDARLDAFAQEKIYDNMDKARLAVLTTDYAGDGRTANAAYETTWTAAIALKADVRAGTLTPEQAVENLPELTWENHNV
jgi:hypothetical protein